MQQCKAATTPEFSNSNSNDNSDIMPNATPYRSIVGDCMYLAVSTRPDLAHAANTLSRGMQQPTTVQYQSAKRVLRYMSGTSEHGLVYRRNNSNNNNRDVFINAYCDANYAGDRNDRRSTSGYCVFLNGNLVSWATKKQQTVALSTCEAELMALSEVVKEVKWMMMLLTEMRYHVVLPIIINVDNQSAIKISENDECHERTKHIDVRHFSVRDEIRNRIVQLRWVESQQQLADIMTKKEHEW